MTLGFSEMRQICSERYYRFHCEGLLDRTLWMIDMADTTGITKQHKLQFVIMYIYYVPPHPPRTPYFGISRPCQNTYFAADHNRQNGKQTTSQKIKASKYHMRALGTAAPNSNTINIILHNNSYLPAVQWPKWQQIFTSPNGQATNNNNLPVLQWPKWQTYPP